MANYGSQSGIIARELRKKGIESISVTYIDRFNRATDVVIGSNKDSFFYKYAELIWRYIKFTQYFFQYDIFHFYFGSSLFYKRLDLPLYKIFRKKVVCHYLGVDVQLYEISKLKYAITNVSGYIQDGEKHDKKIKKRLAIENKYADVQIVCAPYLSEFVENSVVVPLAIELEEYKFSKKAISDDEIVVMHAPTSRNNKGTAYILDAIDKLVKEGFKIRTILVENVSHDELKKKYEECDIFIDQLLAGWYGTASIEAMALGRPTICFIREAYFEHINYGDSIPIINANPQTIYLVLKKTIENKSELLNIGEKSRRFVEKIHCSKAVTDQIIAMYNKIIK